MALFSLNLFSNKSITLPKSLFKNVTPMCIEGLSDLNPGHEYVLFGKETMMGLLVLCFCRESIFDKITNVTTNKVKTGFMGNIGNKGSVVVRFDLHDTSVIVACSHLESGDERVHDRIKNIFDISQQSFSSVNKEYEFEKHDVKILFGDLNFRIAYPYEATLEFIDSINENNKEEKVKALFELDQLKIVKERYEWLSEYLEMPVTFLPTYKFVSNKNEYDTSSK